MHFVVVLVVFEAAQAALPVGGEDLLVACLEALVYLECGSALCGIRLGEGVGVDSRWPRVLCIYSDLRHDHC